MIFKDDLPLIYNSLNANEFLKIMRGEQVTVIPVGFFDKIPCISQFIDEIDCGWPAIRCFEKDILPGFKKYIIIRLSKITLYYLEKCIKRTEFVAIMIGHEVIQPAMLSSKLMHFTQLVDQIQLIWSEIIFNLLNLFNYFMVSEVY